MRVQNKKSGRDTIFFQWNFDFIFIFLHIASKSFVPGGNKLCPTVEWIKFKAGVVHFDFYLDLKTNKILAADFKGLQTHHDLSIKHLQICIWPFFLIFFIPDIIGKKQIQRGWNGFVTSS